MLWITWWPNNAIPKQMPTPPKARAHSGISKFTGRVPELNMPRIAAKGPTEFATSFAPYRRREMRDKRQGRDRGDIYRQIEDR